MISAKVILDSISPLGIRLTTFQITAHRFILAEINTHRVLSRNYRSSRAVPSHKLIQEVRENPAMPVYWGKDVSGMQAKVELTDLDLETAKIMWRASAQEAVYWAKKMADAGLHKQTANRVLEPYLWVHGVISSTEWANFYALRDHRDAQPEFQILAAAMKSAQEASTPTLLKPGQWHLPYIDQQDWDQYPQDAIGYGSNDRIDGPGEEGVLEILRKVSAARCARVSYRVFHEDRRSRHHEDIELFDRLVRQATEDPVHASPLEHPATPDELAYFTGRPINGPKLLSEQRNLWGNFQGWIQFRKTIPGEFVADR